MTSRRQLSRSWAAWFAAAVVSTVLSMLVATHTPAIRVLNLRAMIGVPGIELQPEASRFAPVSAEVLTDILGARAAKRLLSPDSGPETATGPDVSGPADPFTLTPDGEQSPPDTVTDQPDIRIKVRVDKSTAHPGDTLTYAITVTNVGRGAAKRLHITSHIPDHTTYDARCDPVTVTPGAGPSGLPASDICALPQPAPGEHGFTADWERFRPGWRDELVFHVIVNPDAPPGTVLRNHAHAEAVNLPRARTSNEVRTTVGA